MRVVKLDFETFFSTKEAYTLKKMTTEEYIRDPRFSVIMVTIKIDDGKTYSIVGDKEVGEHLVQLQLGRPDTVVVAHNARFDVSIIEWHYKIRVNMALCTIYMMRETGIARVSRESLDALAEFLSTNGYPVPPKLDTLRLMDGKRLSDMSPQELVSYITYAIRDTDILSIAFDIMLPFCSAEALEAMDMTLKMYTRPFLRLDTQLLTSYLDRLQQERIDNLQALAYENGFLTVETFLEALRSKPTFANLLIKLGVSPPMKLSEKRSEKAGELVYDYAFAKGDLEFQALRHHTDPKVVALVEARLNNNSSIAESRTKTFLAISIRGTLPIPYEYAGAHTSRYSAGNKTENVSSDKTNLQNLPKRGGDKTLRKTVLAPEGYELGACDSSQIEARLLAYAAQQLDLLDEFKRDGDPYSTMAGLIYNEDPDVIFYWAKGAGSELEDPESLTKKAYYTRLRNVGKETILGSGYQMSGKKFALRLKQSGVELTPTEQDTAQWRALLQSGGYSGAELDAAMEEWFATFHDREADRINTVYRGANLQVKAFWRVCSNVLDRMVLGQSGYFGGPNGDLFFFDGSHKVFGQTVPGIRLPDGYWILYPQLTKYFDEESGYYKFKYWGKEGSKFVWKFIYGGAMTENLMQGLAFAILKWQALRINRELPIRFNVHDEWGVTYPIHLREKARTLITKWMRTAPPWCPNVPLDCEYSFGPNYGAC